MIARRQVSVLVVLLLALAPTLAHACAVCFDSSDKNRAAFFATAIFLSLLPLGMIGGLYLWLRHRAHELGER